MLTATETYTVRHLDRYDPIPTDVWPHIDLNPHWAWCVVNDNGEVVAILLTAPAHGTLLLLRIWAKPGTPPMQLRRMIKQAARECQSLGINTWMVMLEASQIQELRLAKLALRFKGVGRGWSGFIYGGRMDMVCPKG